MDDNTIQYQQRTETLTNWDILERLPSLIDADSLSYEEYTVLQEFRILYTSLCEIENKEKELDIVAKQAEKLESSEPIISAIRVKIEEAQDERFKVLKELIHFDAENAYTICELVKIGRPIIEAQEREKDRIILEEHRKQKCGTPTTSTFELPKGSVQKAAQEYEKQCERAEKEKKKSQRKNLIRDRLSNTFGALGIVLFFAIRAIIAILPFVMIGGNFFVSFLLIGINLLFPATSAIFWLWGLVCAIKGVQDVWAILYYIVLAIVWVPFYISTIISFFKKE